MSALECGCFPDLGTLAELVNAARMGHRVPYVGDGSADTVIACEHDSVRLGDLLDYEDDAPPVDDQGEQTPTCKEPGCEKPPAKGRKWCSTHANPANRAG